MHALSRAGRLSDAYQVLAEYPEHDGPVARTSIVSALARAGKPDEALSLIYECRKRGMEMSAPHAYTAVLHSFGVTGRADDAVKLLREALETGVDVDVLMYDAVIRAYGRAGRLKEAFGMLGTLRSRGMRPTDCTFEGLIYACAHAGVGEGLARRAFVIYEAAKAEGRASARVTSAVASAVLRTAHVGDGKAMDVLKEMKEIWKSEGDGLREVGVDPGKFRDKMRDLDRLCRTVEGHEKTGWEK